MFFTEYVLFIYYIMQFYIIIVVIKMDIFHCYLIRYYIICYKINNNLLAKKTVKFIMSNINKIYTRK